MSGTQNDRQGRLSMSDIQTLPLELFTVAPDDPERICRNCHYYRRTFGKAMQCMNQVVYDAVSGTEDAGFYPLPDFYCNQWHQRESE